MIMFTIFSCLLQNFCYFFHWIFCKLNDSFCTYSTYFLDYSCYESMCEKTSKPVTKKTTLVRQKHLFGCAKNKGLTFFFSKVLKFSEILITNLKRFRIFFDHILLVPLSFFQRSTCFSRMFFSVKNFGNKKSEKARLGIFFRRFVSIIILFL